MDLQSVYGALESCGAVLCGNRLVRAAVFLIAALTFNLCPDFCRSQEPPEVQLSTPQTPQNDNASSQESRAQSDQPEATPKSDDTEGKKKKETSRGSFLLVPLPISSPAIGSGIVPVAAYIFPLDKNDKVSPPSVIGVAGLVTNNGSRGFAVGGEFYLKEDTYRIKTGFVRGNVNYDVYAEGNADLKLPLNQTGKAFFGSVSRKVGWKFYLGARGLAGSSVLALRHGDENMVPIPPDVGLNTTLSAMGIELSRNTASNRSIPPAELISFSRPISFRKVWGVNIRFRLTKRRSANIGIWEKRKFSLTTPISAEREGIRRFMGTASMSREPIAWLHIRTVLHRAIRHRPSWSID